MHSMNLTKRILHYAQLLGESIVCSSERKSYTLILVFWRNPQFFQRNYTVTPAIWSPGLWYVLRHENFLHDIMEGKMMGKATLTKNRIIALKEEIMDS